MSTERTDTPEEAAARTWYAAPADGGARWRLYDTVHARPYRVAFELTWWFCEEAALDYARQRGLSVRSAS